MFGSVAISYLLSQRSKIAASGELHCRLRWSVRHQTQYLLVFFMQASELEQSTARIPSADR